MYREIVENLREAEDEYIQRAEEKILSMPVSSKRQKTGGKDDEQTNKVEQGYNFWANPEEGVEVETPSGETVLVVPTTEELRARIVDPVALLQIAKYRRDARQQADEKVAVADQTYAVVDAAVKRLDADLEKFEGSVP